MRKLFTSLCVAVLTVVGAASAWAQNSFVYEKTNTKLTAEQLTAGTLVTIQATGDNNSGFFGGTGPVSATFRNDGSTVYEIVKEEGASTISFKQVSSGLYLKNPTGNNPGLDFVTNISEAAKMTVAKADGTDGKANATTFTGNLIANVEVGALYRFKVGRYILNCQGPNSPAGWRGGDRGWTVFYIWQVNKVESVNVTLKYTYKGVPIEGKDVSLTLNPNQTFTSQGVTIPSYYGVVGAATPALTSNPISGGVLTINYEDDPQFPHPFKFYSQVNAQNDYYTLQVKGQYAKYTGEADSPRSFSLGNDFVLGDNYRFQFVGDPIRGFLLYNKAVGTEKALRMISKTANNATLNVKEDATEVRLLLKRNQNEWFFLVEGTANNYINHRDGYLSTWDSPLAITTNDPGSRIIFKAASDQAFYTNELSDYKKGKLGYYKTFPAIFTGVEGVETKLEAISLTAFTADALVAAKQQVDAAIQEYEESCKSKVVKVLIKNRAPQDTYSSGDKTYHHKNEYMENTAEGGLYARKTTAEAANQYELRYQGQRVFQLYSSVARNYVQVASQSAVVKSGKEAKNYRLDPAAGVLAGENVGVFFSVEGTGNYRFLHFAPHQNSGVVGWDASSPASQWLIESSPISEDDVQRAISAFEKARYDVVKQRLQQTPIDADKFGCAKPTEASATALAKIIEVDQKESSAVVTEDEYKEAVAAIEAALASLTEINGLKDNAFYTFKAVQANRYLFAPTTTKALETTTDVTLGNVFYAQGGMLTSVKEGKNVGLNTNAALLGYGTAGLPVSGAAFADNLDVAAVKVGERFTYVHDNGNLDGASSVLPDHLQGFKFEVKEVTEIPLPIREIGYASFYTPVALTVQQGYAAYKATKDPENVNSLVLTEITGTIPANTAFVVKGETNTTCTLTVVKNDAGVEVGENVLSGGVETTAIQGTAYALTKKGESEAVFGKVSAEVKQIAFRAFYINNTVNPVNEMSFSFKSTLTGVAPLKGNNEAAPLYDLSGRRVLSPAKGGIYIQNGQKVIAQ